MRDNVVIYRSFHEASKALTPEEYKELWTTIFNYALNGELPEDGIKSPLAEAIFTMALPQIDANTKRYQDGCRGGAPKGNQNAKKQPKQPVVNSKNNHRLNEKQPNDNDNVNDNDNDNVNDNNIKFIRHKYGEYKNVLLSDDEFEKLKKQFPEDYQQRIENLSGYMKSFGKTYKDHLATIRNWARRDEAKKMAAGDKSNGEMLRSNYDMSELERKLLNVP